MTNIRIVGNMMEKIDMNSFSSV